MALTFANQSRSYDKSRRQIRFVGHDGIFEVPFLLEVDSLSKGKSGPATSEEEHLAAFDSAREAVQSVAREAYSNGRKRVYVLTPPDFR